MASAQFQRFSPIALWRGAWWHGDRHGAIPKSALPWLRVKRKSTKRHIEGSLNKRAQCLPAQWNASSNKAMIPKAATPFGVHFFSSNYHSMEGAFFQKFLFWLPFSLFCLYSLHVQEKFLIFHLLQHENLLFWSYKKENNLFYNVIINKTGILGSKW